MGSYHKARIHRIPLLEDSLDFRIVSFILNCLPYFHFSLSHTGTHEQSWVSMSHWSRSSCHLEHWYHSPVPTSINWVPHLIPVLPGILMSVCQPLFKDGTLSPVTLQTSHIYLALSQSYPKWSLIQFFIICNKYRWRSKLSSYVPQDMQFQHIFSINFPKICTNQPWRLFFYKLWSMLFK